MCCLGLVLGIMAVPAYYYPVLGFVQAQLIVNCIVCFLVVVVVGLRVVCRQMGPGIGWDDGFVIFAAVCVSPIPQTMPYLTLYLTLI